MQCLVTNKSILNGNENRWYKIPGSTPTTLDVQPDSSSNHEEPDSNGVIRKGSKSFHVASAKSRLISMANYIIGGSGGGHIGAFALESFLGWIHSSSSQDAERNYSTNNR
eukprot:scaffold602_cov179-Ochromonas_danica.AAC.20